MSEPGGTGAGGAGTVAHLTALTGIRGLAALYVLVMHLNMAISQVNFGDYLRLVFYGYLGVDLFFVLSGFIISHVYSRDFDHFSLDGYRRFMWHRFARLYPVHVLVIVVLVAMVGGAGLIGLTFNEPSNWSFGALPLHLLLVHAWGFIDQATWNTPAWSISAEWLAYLSFPAAVVAVRPVRSVALGLGAALVVLAAMALLFDTQDWRLGHAWVGAPALVRVAGEFLIGCLLYRVFLAVDRPSGWWDLIGVGALCGFVAVATYAPDDFIMIGLIALFVMAASRARAVLHGFLASRLMMALGEISYSIYMIHFAYILVLTRVIDRMGWNDGVLLTGLAVLVGSVMLVCALSAVTYRWVERPGRRFLKARGLGAPKAAPAA